jgi:hypothetical protein
MLHTFCNGKLETVTSDAVYNPQITMATAITTKTIISQGDCSIVKFQDHHSAETRNNIWDQWHHKDESFDQFVQRIQHVDPDNIREGFFLMHPQNPEFCFPDMVREFLPHLSLHIKLITTLIASSAKYIPFTRYQESFNLNDNCISKSKSLYGF